MVKSGRKRIDPLNKKIMAGYSMSQILISKLISIAEDKGLSTSRLVECILQKYVDNIESQKGKEI